MSEQTEEYQELVSRELVQKKIIRIRGKNVMLDHDLASLYGVPTQALKQSVKRNRERFPADFMFELTDEEMKNWRSQFGPPIQP
jgi:ORF6N domain.